MASILQVSGSSVSVFPGTTGAAPNGLFPTTDRNDGSAYSWSSSTSTATLPSTGLADGYLFVANVEVEITHNNRLNVLGYFTQTVGTGTVVSFPGGGYARDNSEDRAYLTCAYFIDNPSASAQIQFQWLRDTGDGTPAGSVPRATLQVIPLYYSDWAGYGSTTNNLYGGTTPNQVTGFTGVDGTNITMTSNQISVTGDNKRYLVIGGGYTIGHGGRTQRWYGLEIDGSFDDAAKTCVYYRDTTNDISGGICSKIIETATATRTIELNAYRGDGVAAGQGGADGNGSTPTTSSYGLLVLELNDDCEVYYATDSTGGQELALTGPVDIDIASTTDIDFNDSASFTRASDIAVNAEVAMDALVLANISQARGAAAIGSGQRWTAHGEVTVNGAEQTDYFHGNYNRGNQGSIDTHGSSQNLINAVALVLNDDIGFSVQELSGTEGGGGDIETQAGWVGFGLINLDTMEASGGADVTAEPGAGSLTLTGNAPGTLVSLSVDPANGSLTLTGEAPTAATTNNLSISVPAGTLAVTGEAPVVQVSISAAPDAGVVALTGEIPTLDQTADHIRAPPVGALSLAGLTPTLGQSNDQTVDPGTANLSLTGNAPAVDLSENQIVATGYIERFFTLYAPTIDLTENRIVNAGYIDRFFTLYAPSISISDSQSPAPGVGSVSLIGNQPTAALSDNKAITPPTGGLTLSGSPPAPSISAGDITVEPGTGSLTLTPYVPARAEGLQLVGYIPTAEIQSAGNDITTEPGAGSLTLNGLQPVINVTLSAEPGVGNLTLTRYAPSVSVADNQVVTPDTGELNLTGYLEYNYGGPGLRLIGYEPSVAIEVASPAVEPGVGSLNLTGYAPTPGIDWVVYPDAGVLTLTGYVPTVTLVSGDALAEPGAGSLTLTGYAPDAKTGFNISAGAGTLTLTSYAPALTISDNQFPQPDAGSLTITGFAPTIGFDWVVFPDPGSLTIQGYVPEVVFGIRELENGLLRLTGHEPNALLSKILRQDLGGGTRFRAGISGKFEPENRAITMQDVGNRGKITTGRTNTARSRQRKIRQKR